MSDLSPKYLELIPIQLQKFIKELNLVIKLDKKFPLIKDRSILAHEERYI